MDYLATNRRPSITVSVWDQGGDSGFAVCHRDKIGYPLCDRKR
jgi:hypothetical protein